MNNENQNNIEKLKMIDPAILRQLQENPELLLLIAGDKFKISIENVEPKDSIQNEENLEQNNFSEIKTNPNQPTFESIDYPNANSTPIQRHKRKSKSPQIFSTQSFESLTFQDSPQIIAVQNEENKSRHSNRYFTSSRTPSLSELEAELEGIEGKEGERLKKIAKALRKKAHRMEKSSSQTSTLGLKDDPLRCLINELREKKLKAFQPQSIHENSLHFAFIFSSPLVMTVVDNQGNMLKRPMKSPIQYRKELEFIEESFHETGCSIRYQSLHASLNTFAACLDKKPFCLHFCGHGIRNSSEILGMYIDRKQGDFLVFEDDSCSADLVSCKALSRILENIKSSIKLVFVASCHSELVGGVFLDAGATHVICVRREEKILDVACQTFSNAFYSSLIPGQFSICESFHAAIARVYADHKIPPGEENKFKLLLSPSLSPHICSSFPTLYTGVPANLSPVPKYLHIPASIDNFVGRDREMNEVIGNFSSCRLVTITGIPGIGKSAISKEISLLLKERNKFCDGITFFQLRNIESAESLQAAIDGLIHEVTDAKSKSDDRSKLLLRIVTTLKDSEILFVFDNCDLILVGPEKMRFRLFLECLLSSCPKLKILCTNRTPLGGPLGDTPEKVIRLSPLNMNESRILFNYHLPRAIPDDTSCILELLKGHPYAITLAAGLLSDNSVEELTAKLHFPRPSFTFPSLEDSGPLKISMDLALEWVSSKFHEKAGKLFSIFGLLPGGLNERDLEYVVGESCEENLRILINTSLLIKSNHNYLVYPFFLKYAETRLKAEDKSKFHKKITALYSKKVEEVYFMVGSVIGADYEVYDYFREYEINVKACVYREKGSEEKLYNRLSFIPVEDGELEEQDSVSMPLTKESLKLLQMSKPKFSKESNIAERKGFGHIEMPIAGRMSYTPNQENNEGESSSGKSVEFDEADKIDAVKFDEVQSYLKNEQIPSLNEEWDETEEVKTDSEIQKNLKSTSNSSFSIKIGIGMSTEPFTRPIRNSIVSNNARKVSPNKQRSSSGNHHSMESRKKMPNISKLLIHYTSILLMMRRYKECRTFIDISFSLPRIHNLFLGNILKVKASLSFISKDMISSFNEFCQAEELFREEGCSLGIAICTGAKGYIKFVIGEHAKARLYLESSLKYYYSLKHSYGEHYVHRWLAAVKRKIGSLSHQSQDHVDAARKALTGNKSIKSEKFKHKGGVFVLRWMGDNISLFLETAYVCDVRPVKGGKVEKMERSTVGAKEDDSHNKEIRFIGF